MSFINEKLHLFCAKLAWKKQFPGNSRLGFNPVGTENITIGRGTYGHINILTSDANPCLSIGSYCSIARDVTFVIGDEHPLNLFSTFPFKVMTLGEPVKEAFGKGGVTVGDDVWLGYRSTILDGVTIARGGSLLRGLWSQRTSSRTQSSVECRRDLSESASTTRPSRPSAIWTSTESIGDGFPLIWNSSTVPWICSLQGSC